MELRSTFKTELCERESCEIKESARDRCLLFHWRAINHDWISSLDLPLARNRRYEARASVLLEALIADLVAPGQWTSYSRRKEWWSTGRRYRGTSYTYVSVIAAVDELTALGFVEHDRKPPGNLGWQSRFRATPKLLQAVKHIPTVIYDPVELIRLKDRDDKLIDYRDTNNTISMRRRLEEINEALSAADLQLHAPAVQHDGMLLRVGDDHLLYPAMRNLYRIFTRGSFSCGGRFYGGWWQQIPKKIRPNLLIDGEPTVEHDYPQLHPKMLYAEIGARPDGDAYAFDGWDRNLVKRAFNILVNAGTHESARRAIALKIGGEGAHAKAASLIEAIKLRHPRISDRFHSDAGIRLQRRDADMAEKIMRRLAGQGIGVFPIHDSFITAARHEDALKEAMGMAWAHFIGGDQHVIPNGYDKIDPQMEMPPASSSFPAALPAALPAPSASCSKAARPGLLVVLPVARALDLFGGRPRPVSDLAGWSSGVPPSAVRAYLRDEIVGRGFRQSDIARRLGISRPQLVNILRGRFGASPRVTLGLKSFVGVL